MLKDGRWAKDWNHCQECGTIDRPHYAHGLCGRCYNHQYERPQIACKECGELMPHLAHGLCEKCYNRQYHSEHLKERNEYNRRLTKEHREEARIRARQWYWEHREETLAYQRQYRKDHPPEPRRLVVCRECGEEKPHAAHGLCKTCYRRQRPEANSRYRSQWRKDHREEAVERCRLWREKNPDYKRQWREENPQKVWEYDQRRRARKAKATIEEVDRDTIYELYNRTCIYCGATENSTIDHIVALDNGGPHCEDNLVVACGHCNSSKGTKSLGDWLQTQPRALAWVM